MKERLVTVLFLTVTLIFCLPFVSKSQRVNAQTKPVTYPEIITALNTKLPNAAFKNKATLINYLIKTIENRGVEKELSKEMEEVLRQSGATDELIETIKSKFTDPSFILSKFYQDMSDEEKIEYISLRADEILDRFGRAEGDEIPPDGIERIKSFLDAYMKRLSVPANPKSGSPFSDNLKDVLERGSKVSPFIIEAMKGNNLPTEMGIYTAMIESEFANCLQAPTGPLGMFQFTYASAQTYFNDPANIVRGANPANPDDRCKPLEAARGYSKYMKVLLDKPDFDMFTNDSTGISLLLASFNSGEGALRANIRKVREVKGQEKVTFWDMAANADSLSNQFQAENSKYVPKFFAAAIIGENPLDFNLLEIEPLSTLSPSSTVVQTPTSTTSTITNALNVSVEFWESQRDKAMGARSEPTGSEPPGLVRYEELTQIVRQTEALNNLKTRGVSPPLDFIELAEKSQRGELTELPIATENYLLDVGGNATEAEFTTYSFKNGSKIASPDSAKYQTLKKLSANFSGQRYDLNNPRDRRQMKIRLLRMVQPKAKVVLEEIAGKYRQKFNRPLRVTSLTRSLEYQISLNANNANSFRVSSEGVFPPHSSGLAFDFSYKQMTAAEQNFLSKLFVELENQGKIEALREGGANAAFHIFVLP